MLKYTDLAMQTRQPCKLLQAVKHINEIFSNGKNNA